MCPFNGPSANVKQTGHGVQNGHECHCLDEHVASEGHTSTTHFGCPQLWPTLTIRCWGPRRSVLASCVTGCGIGNDDYFELMIRNAWHLSGGEGWCENTSCRSPCAPPPQRPPDADVRSRDRCCSLTRYCLGFALRRVLVTHTHGGQTVQEIKNDLGIGPHDVEKMKANLEAQVCCGRRSGKGGAPGGVRAGVGGEARARASGSEKEHWEGGARRSPGTGTPPPATIRGTLTHRSALSLESGT